jgi:lipid II:glycine glycyltransferase (peptidoglycan interpeptide bridge formation enzyme)
MKNSPTVSECTAAEYALALSELPHTEPISFLQAPFYGAWQERDGKTVVYFTARDGDTLVASGLAVKYDAPHGISFFYCPYGPVATVWTPELFAALRAFFAPVCKRTSTTFVRFDSTGLEVLPGVKRAPNHLAVTASLQPRAEWLLDITAGEQDIWMGMHKHARYNVRLAERANAQIAFYAPAEAPLDVFLSLMQVTSERDSFSLQNADYYKAVLQSVPADCSFVAVCSIDGKPAATALFAAYDSVVHYVFAGSSNEFRKIAPPYFLIWNSVLEARKNGWHTLNFGGISDEVKGTHLAGVTGFKKRFGGYEVTHENPVDLVYTPFKYALFGAYKRLKG